MKKTTFFYIFKEIFPIFFIGLMVFTIILLMDKILKLIELIMDRGGNLSNIIMLFIFISPSFLIITIPIAVLLSTLLAFGRLSSDSEITAFKASGTSLYQLFIPVYIFALIAFLITSFLVFYGLPWGNRGFKATLFLVAQSKRNVEIKERVFNDMFHGLVIYVNQVPIQGNRMEGILIYDDREKGKSNTIIAREGFFIHHPESQEIILRLLEGDIHRYEPQAQTFQRIKFDTYDLRLELSKALVALGKKLKEFEMSIDEIKEKIALLKKIGKDTTSQEVELYKRYTLPFTCIIFALIGVPLGIQPRRSGRSYGFILSIFILLAYYIMVIAFEFLAINHTIPPYLASGAPPLLFSGLGIYLLIKAARESSFKPALWLIEGIDRLQQKWKRMVDHV